MQYQNPRNAAVCVQRLGGQPNACTGLHHRSAPIHVSTASRVPTTSHQLSAKSTTMLSTSRQPAAPSAYTSGASSVRTSGSPQATVDYFSTDRRPIILYDGVCNMCNAAVDFMLKYDTAGNFRMAALQSQAGQRLLEKCGRPGDISSIVLVEENGSHLQSDAVLRIARRISNPFPFLAILGFPVPPFIRNFIYDQVANNRYSFLGRRDVCRLSNAGFEDRFIVD